MHKDIKEKVNKKEFYIGWGAFIVLVLHFSFVLLSIVPSDYTSEKSQAFAKAYTDPIFEQRWSMFAPCPILENRIEIKYHFSSNSTNWIDPVEAILPKHQAYRFTYHGNLVIGYSNMLYWLKLELDRLETPINQPLDFSQQKALRNSMGNRLLHKYVFGYARENLLEKPIGASLHVSYRNITTDSTTHYYFTNYK